MSKIGIPINNITQLYRKYLFNNIEIDIKNNLPIDIIHLTNDNSIWVEIDQDYIEMNIENIGYYFEAKYTINKSISDIQITITSLKINSVPNAIHCFEDLEDQLEKIPNCSNKRESYISWDECFMNIALVASLRSKDPSTQVGCCLVKDNKIISVGYNGFPNGCSDDEFPWGKDSDNPLETKYFYVVHAELNAILNSNCNPKGSTAYVTLFPCNECAKALIQAGIKEIVYLNDKDSIEQKASKRMLDIVGIKYRLYQKENSWLISI